MTSRLRVAYFGTGHTGTQVLRQILQRPDPNSSATWFTRRKRSARTSWFGWSTQSLCWPDMLGRLEKFCGNRGHAGGGT